MIPATDHGERLLVVTPIHREAEYLDRVAAAMSKQQRRPDHWLVVDDASSDGSREIVCAWARDLDFMTVIDAPETPAGAGADGLVLARDARAFNHGLNVAGWRGFTHVAKIDGDIELPPNWFGDLLRRFREQPDLGIAGGRLVEPDHGGWQQIPIPGYHVHGAVKLYRRECLEAIGGVPERLAWDTIDETYARMRGYETHSPPELIARHHRRVGTADGRLRGRARHGECAWILHQTVPWALLRSAKSAQLSPVGLSGAAFFYGYVRAAMRGTPRVEDPNFRRYIRRELRGRIVGSGAAQVHQS